MADDKKKSLDTGEEKDKLPQGENKKELSSGEEKKQLDSGEDTPKLEDGSTLALDALEKAAETARQSIVKGNDEVAKSDELAKTLHSLQNLIERYGNQLSELQAELKERRQMLRNVFENDTQLREAKEKSKEYRKEVRKRKSELQSDPQVTALKVQVKELKQDRKELKATLSDHLITYHQLTNSKSVDTHEGDQWDFDIKAKLKRR